MNDDMIDAAWNDLPVSPALFFESIASLNLPNRIVCPLRRALTLVPIEQVMRWGQVLPQAELVGQLLLRSAKELLQIHGFGCGALAQLAVAVEACDARDSGDPDSDEIARRARALAHFVCELEVTGYMPVDRLRVLAFNARRRGVTADAAVFLQAAEHVHRIGSSRA